MWQGKAVAILVAYVLVCVAWDYRWPVFILAIVLCCNGFEDGIISVFKYCRSWFLQHVWYSRILEDVSRDLVASVGAWLSWLRTLAWTAFEEDVNLVHHQRHPQHHHHQPPAAGGYNRFGQGRYNRVAGVVSGQERQRYVSEVEVLRSSRRGGLMRPEAVALDTESLGGLASSIKYWWGVLRVMVTGHFEDEESQQDPNNPWTWSQSTLNGSAFGSEEEELAFSEFLLSQYHKNETQLRLECPINKVVMRNPVLAADGFSYEASAIRRWISNSLARNVEPRSPMTGEALGELRLIPNRVLKSIIEEYKEEFYALRRRRSVTNVSRRRSGKILLSKKRSDLNNATIDSRSATPSSAGTFLTRRKWFR